MGRLFVLFFLLPWWTYVPASIGVLWLGERVYERALATEAEKVAALQTAVPAPVDLGAFDRDRDIHAADEVHVIGLIDHELDYELVERTNGVPTKTRYLYMIFGADEFGSKVVRAALMLDKREEAQFLDTKADQWAIGVTSEYRVYEFNGFADRTATLDEMADSAIEEQGLTKAADFIYVEPFFEGREAALAPRGRPEQSRYIGWAIAALVALIGVVKRVRSVRARPKHVEQEQLDLTGGDEFSAAPSAAPAMAFSVPDGVSLDTPLGRLARRSAAPAAQAPDDPLVQTSDHDPDPEADYFDETLDEETPDAQPAQAFAHEAHPGLDDAAASPFTPDADGDVQPAPPRASATSFYVKLAFAMILVGTLTYDPSLLTASLPVAVIALFWFATYAAVRRFRNGAKRRNGGGEPAPQHARRPDGALQPVTAGVGRQGIDLTAPVRSARRERGVI